VRHIAAAIVLILCIGQAAKCGDAPQPVDDRAINRKLEQEGAALVEAGRTVPIATLIEQLQTKTCALTLEPPSKDPIPLESFYERTKASVLVIAGIYKCSKCAKLHAAPAGGYAIGKSGVCVTNYHVVNTRKWDTLIAMTPDGRVMPVKAVLAANAPDDVAILQLDGDGLVPLAFGADGAVGSRVRVINHPDGRFYVYTEGVISRYFKIRHKRADAVMMAITADFAKGSSGAPVFNDYGAVIGMVAATESIYYNVKDGHGEDLQMVVKECVPSSSILKLIEQTPRDDARRE
jgi:hypothetical protein